jgi:hypothetical protein
LRGGADYKGGKDPLGLPLEGGAPYAKMMSWRPLFLALVLVALSPMAAEAQTPARSPTADEREELQSLPPQQLRARRHEQTREEDVRRLETERFGQAKVERQQSQQKDEVDQLYQQVIKQSEELSGAR